MTGVTAACVCSAEPGPPHALSPFLLSSLPRGRFCDIIVEGSQNRAGGRINCLCAAWRKPRSSHKYRAPPWCFAVGKWRWVGPRPILQGLELATQSSNELDSKRPNDTIFIHSSGKHLVSTCYTQHSRATDRKDRVLAAQGSTQSGLRGSAAGCGV